MGLFSVIEHAMKALWMCSGTLYSWCAFVDDIRINGETIDNRIITELWKTLPCHITVGFQPWKVKMAESNVYFTQWGQFSWCYCNWISKWQNLRHQTIEDSLLGWLFTLSSSLNWNASCYKTWSLPSLKQLSAAYYCRIFLAVSQDIKGPVTPAAISACCERQEFLLRSCQPEQKLQSQAGWRASQLPSQHRQITVGVSWIWGCSCQTDYWADQPDFRCLRSVE